MTITRTVWVGLVVTGVGLGGVPALAQTSGGTGLPSGFTAPGLPFGPTSSVATVASPSPTMALANPGGLSFGGASRVSGLGASTPSSGNAGGLSFSGAAATAVGGSGLRSAGGGALGRRPLDDVVANPGSGGGGGAPASAGIAGGAGFSRRPTDAYFDPLSGSGLR
ncbi:1,3-beta-glucanase [Methylobacterium sp. J-043]|nr:1,3-beta-glucanase [Methylobacterium sp. J-043]